MADPLIIWGDEKGPIIRINPDELHINDPDYYDEVFNNSGAKVEKPFREANSFGPFPAVRDDHLSLFAIHFIPFP